MTSAGRISVSTIKESWPVELPIWTGWPARACASLTITRRRAAPPDGRISSLANCRFGLASRQSDRPGANRHTRSGRTIAHVLKSMGYATGQFGKNHLGDRTSFCQQFTVSTSFGATSITSMRWKTRFIATIHRLFSTGLARATCCTAWQAMWTIRRSILAGARSASKKSPTRARCRPTRRRTSSTTWKPSTRSFATRRWNSSTRQGSRTSRFSSGSTPRACMS